jgi:hypothetical protein
MCYGKEKHVHMTNKFLIDRVVALFHNIQLKYGLGDIYKTKVLKGFNHHFDFTNIIFNDQELSVGLYHGNDSAVVLFCDSENAFKEGIGGLIIHSITAGPTGPNPHYYKDRIIMNCSDSERPKITVFEILPYLGRISGISEIPKDLVLEIVLADDASISEVKKHL